MKNIKPAKLLFKIIVVLTFVLSCNSDDSEKWFEIHKLSKIVFPENSSLVNYFNNEEFQIVFQIKIPKDKCESFKKRYGFKPIEKQEQFVQKTASFRYIKSEIQNGFSPPIIIPSNKNLFLYSKDLTSIVLDSELAVLYGIVSY